MEDFKMYFTEGWNHIMSSDALDHQLFILSLAALFLWKDWRRVLVLVTAFTIGHSLTLALSVYDVIRFSIAWVEFLIPITILLTALYDLRYLNISKIEGRNIQFNYIIALSFGLVHGMGFANSIRQMLASDQTIGIPLLSFNIGLEVGQIVLILLILIIAQLLVVNVKLPRKYWILLLSVIPLILSLRMALERIPF
ncbi:MAG TPA: HupE/UreJ family protein [Saprospiraceae bacterium]|nr:HupE/UreJ family protein [Saprospiraceae bacterium]